MAVVRFRFRNFRRFSLGFLFIIFRRRFFVGWGGCIVWVGCICCVVGEICWERGAGGVMGIRKEDVG